MQKFVVDFLSSKFDLQSASMKLLIDEVEDFLKRIP